MRPEHLLHFSIILYYFLVRGVRNSTYAQSGTGAKSDVDPLFASHAVAYYREECDQGSINGCDDELAVALVKRLAELSVNSPESALIVVSAHTSIIA